LNPSRQSIETRQGILSIPIVVGVAAYINPMSFTFVDLFAGIGGFRIGLTAVGGSAVFSNEWDKYAAKTYSSWFGPENLSTEDIRTLDPFKDIPNHDVLCGGFPCQPFSIAGVSKKNSLGRAHGFSDQEQGNLFFSICDIISAKRPKIVLLENVKNLTRHDSGKTWSVILESLDLLGYEVKTKIINASGWVPQNRRRVFIVCFDRLVFSEEMIGTFVFPEEPPRRIPLKAILERRDPDAKYMLTDNLWKYLQEYSKKHRRLGNGFGFRLVGPADVAGTLSARYYKDGAEILIDHAGWRNPRRLTPREAAKLMGFNQKYARMFGLGIHFRK
jgi:DNA (cytosine-5)-methyltransferase 1